MGVTKEATTHLEGTDGEGVFAVIGVSVVWREIVKCVLDLVS